ncbi:unnamed protein product [Sphagnum balticum]
MGSLMSGWDSHPLDDQKVTKRSNSSLTKDEISAFWRSRQRAMEEHLKEAAAQKALAATVTQQVSTKKPKELKEYLIDKHSKALKNTSKTSILIFFSTEVKSSKSTLWTRSNWAFLNFPPEMLLQDSRDRYTPQFDVAAKASNLNEMYSSPSNFSTTL